MSVGPYFVFRIESADSQLILTVFLGIEIEFGVDRMPVCWHSFLLFLSTSMPGLDLIESKTHL